MNKARHKAQWTPNSVNNAFLSNLRRWLAAFFVLASFSFPEGASAQSQRNGIKPVISPAGAAAEATRAERAPKLDGTLDDLVWQSAKPVAEFRQQEPNEGETATEKTEVRILYTRHAVYFGIHCYDSEPAKIVATELRRDVSQYLDDHF